ncbi:splicing associated factor Dre4 [Bulinus truncatus]|nr:splicing associated factor Dre4 [Bulinus truncatus]
MYSSTLKWVRLQQIWVVNISTCMTEMTFMLEQAERELRQKLTSAFKSFCEKVEAITKQEVEFDYHLEILDFMVHHSGVQFCFSRQVTVSVNLSEWPPFVVTLEDIELVHFERVSFQLKNLTWCLFSKITYIAQLTDALIYCHSKEIIHRDIKLKISGLVPRRHKDSRFRWSVHHPSSRSIK